MEPIAPTHENPDRLREAMANAEDESLGLDAPIIDMADFDAALQKEMGLTDEPDQVDIEGNKFAKRPRAEVALEVALKVLGGDNYSPEFTKSIIGFMQRLTSMHEEKATALRSAKERARDLMEADLARMKSEHAAAVAKRQKDGEAELESLEVQLGEVLTRNEGVQAHLNRLINGSGIKPLSGKAEVNVTVEVAKTAEAETDADKPTGTVVDALKSRAEKITGDVHSKIAAADDKLAEAGETKPATVPQPAATKEDSEQ